MYDLTALTYAACPECGSAFDPADPATTLHAPIPHWRRSPIVRVGWRVAVVLLIITGFVHTLFPRPVELDDWRLWVWAGRWFGVRDATFGEVRIRQWFWAGRERRREAFNVPGGAKRWSLGVDGEDRWTLEVNVEGVPWDALMVAFNEMKERWYFGVRFTRPNDPRLSRHSFSVRGRKVEVLSALMDHYDIEATPFRFEAGQEYVWTFDRESRRMRTIDLTPETIELYEFRSMPWTPRLVPREAGDRSASPDGADAGAPAGYLPPDGQAERKRIE